MFVFFFSSRRRHTRYIGDWSSDVCSSDLPTNTVHIGISERYDLSIAHAGGPQNMPGDYMYYNGRLFKLREGSWGIVRVLPDQDGSGLRPLPGHELPIARATSICPPVAPRKSFAVVALD